MLDETEFLSDYGVRGSPSSTRRIRTFSAAEAGSSRWLICRGLRIPESSRRQTPTGGAGVDAGEFPPHRICCQQFHSYYGDDFKIECPTGLGPFYHHSGGARTNWRRRPFKLFLKDEDGRRPMYNHCEKMQRRPAFSRLGLVLRIFPRGHRTRVGAFATKPAGPGWWRIS